jgi:hypothetical protein
MTTRRNLWFAAALAVVGGCKPSDPMPARRPSALPPGIAALVGPDRVEFEMVARVAKASEIPLLVARDRVVFDALLACGARARFGSLATRHAERTAAARRLLETWMADARGAGPPSDSEVGEVTGTRWWELNRPPLRRTTHAVVVVQKPEEEKPARELADRVASAVASATDAASFRTLATSVTSHGLTVKVEDLDPVAEDGRAVNPASPPPTGSETARYSAAYATATFLVPGLFRTSPVIRSEFGFHVILVTELLPEHRVPLEERRRLLEPDVLTQRASKLERDALEHARAVDGVAVERSALDLTEKLNVSP